MASLQTTPVLEDTDKRQAALRRYHVLDTAPEKDFDRITSLVAKVCNVSTALITLIDKERQWFKSCFNFDARETDISVSFCVHAVHAGEMLVVEDATKDPRFKDNPIVTGPPHIRFYAGAPLTTPEGIHIGTLCIIDYEPQVFDAAQREILDRMAEVVVSQFELRSAEAQIRQLIDENPQPMYVYAQSDGRLMNVNSEAVALYGYETSAFAGMTATDLQAPDSHQHFTATVETHKRADGSYFPARVKEREVLFDGQEAVLATVQHTPMHSPDTVFMIVDGEGVVRSVSHDTTQEGPFQDVVGMPFSELANAFDQGALGHALTDLMRGKREVVMQEVVMSAAEQRRPYEVHMRPLRSANGNAVGVTAVLVPLTTPAVSGEPAAPASEDVEGASDAPRFKEEADAAVSPSEEEVAAHAEEAESTESEEADDRQPESGASERNADQEEDAEGEATSLDDAEASDTDTDEASEAEAPKSDKIPAGDGTRQAPPTRARPEPFSGTSASKLLQQLRDREDDDAESAPHDSSQ